MGERKVLNKHYSPDFDPAKLPRIRQPKNRHIKVRTMLPMRSIQCNKCSHYMYGGTKSNVRKEEVVNENYLGIPIFRFYFKCTNCKAELVIKTDPQNSDYTVESGARRNYEKKEKEKREAEETGDANKNLENRILQSKREMDIAATLEEVKSMKSRREVVSIDAMFGALQQTAKEKEKKTDEEDEALIKSLFGRQKEIVRRIDDDEELDKGENFINKLKRRKLSKDIPCSAANYVAKASDSSENEESQTGKEAKGKGKLIFKSPMVTIGLVKKQQPKEENKQEEEKAIFGNTGLQSVLQCYNGSDDD